MPTTRLARPLLVLVAAILALPATSRASIPYVPGEVVVRFREGAGDELRRAAIGAVGGVQTHAVGTPGVQRFHVSGVTVEQAVARLSANPDVVWAEPNYVIEPLAVPNDPRFGDQWPLRNVGQNGGLPDADIRATLAWDLTTGSSAVLVGVLDSGIDYKHPDLAPNIYVNPGEIPENGIDDDGNGYVDDVNGWDFYDGDNDPMDLVGHGTHVAGILGASGNDSLGTTGVCWRVQLMPIRILGQVGTMAMAAEGIRYATRMGVRVTNNSWGSAALSNVLLEAIIEARDAGVLFVAAAGNSSRDNSVFPTYPASYALSNVLSVAATDSRDRLAGFSNFGVTTVHLAAPGVEVLSTVPGGGYAVASGTSMATPHVTGALALLFARQPSLTAEEARARLLGGAMPLASLANRVITGARVDAFVPIAPPDSIAPSPVLDLAVTRVGGEEVDLAWTATGDDGRTGRANRYELRRSLAPIDATNFVSATPVEAPIPQLAGAAERVIVRGLSFSTPWYFALIARDERGNGSALSNVVTAMTLPPPAASVTPAELSAALQAGEAAERIVTLSNTGASDLTFEVRPAFSTAPDAPSLAADPPGLSRVPSGAVSLRLPGDPVEPESATETLAATAAEVESGTRRLEPHPEERARTTFGVYVEGAPGPGPASAFTRGPRTHADGVEVLILAIGTTVERIAEQIAEHPDVASVDVLNASIETPSLATLRPYEAIIVVNNEPAPDRTALGDVLADFVDQGGGLVLALASFVRGFEITGRLTSGGYVPFLNAVGPITGSTLGSYDVNHAIMRGVLSLSGDQRAATEPALDAQLVASWADGEPFVATRRGRVVGVNAFLGDPGNHYQGDVPRVLAQSAAWTARARWLSAEPIQGVVPPGESVTLTVRFDADGVVAGSHEARLEIRTNDPALPLASVAALLDVTGAPDLALAGETIRIVFERSYVVDGATSTFEFRPGVPPAGPIAFELGAEGDFGDPTERAVLDVEGSAIGGLSSTGVDCAAFASIIPVDSTVFVRWMEDGRIDATVRNSPDVNPFCGVNRHLLALRYAGPVDPLDFGATLARARRTVLLRVANRGSAELELGPVEVDRPEFRVSVPPGAIPPGASVLIAVEFAPTVPGLISGTLTLPSNDPDTPRRVVRLTGRGVAGPVARIEPTAIELSVPEAAEATRPLIIANDGESNLHARIEVRPASPVTLRVESVPAAGGPRSRASIEGVSLPRTDEVVYQPLASSPTPITCVIEDPANGTLYGQEEGGRRFFRYRAASDAWEELAGAPIVAHNNGGAALLAGRVYTTYPTVIDSIGVYDIASGTWSTRAAPVSTTAGIASDGTQYLYAVRGDALVRYDPETGETRGLTPLPFIADPWCSLRWFENKLYVHEATGRRRFVEHDLTIEAWTGLTQLPGPAVLGAAIDPVAREYVTRGPSGGFNLYRFSIDRGTWLLSALTAFPAEMSGMGWLPSPVPGICMAQGEAGTGFVRFVDQPDFLSPETTDVTVPPHSSREVAIVFRAGTLPAASYEAALAVTTDDPALTDRVVPVRMTVTGAPRLLLAGQPVTRTSSQTFDSPSERTIHPLPMDPPPAGGGSVRLEADGNYGQFGALATLSLEGRGFGSIAAFGAECDRATAVFTITPATMAALGADGVLEATVQNSAQVDPFECVLNRHRLILTYVASAEALQFGAVAVSEQGRLILDVANTGSAPLTVSSVVADRPEFSVDALSATLSAGERRTLEVRFSPTRGGPVDGTLTVLSNDPSEPTRQVRLSGIGREPPILRVDEAPIRVQVGERTSGTATLEVGNDGAGPLAFEVTPRYVPAARGTGETRRRSSSPGPMTCTTSDPSAQVLYAQQHGSTHFFRYLADEDRWENLPDAPLPAHNDGGAALLNGRVYVAYADQSGLIAVYDIAGRTWSMIEHPLGSTTAGIASDGRRYLYIARNDEVRRWDPVTGETWLMPAPPFTVENWSTLVWFDETLIALRGNQTSQLARLDLARSRWEPLPPVPGVPMMGAAVDPVSRELVTCGGSTIYRLALDGGGWLQSTLPGYAMKDGGLAWLPGPVPGVYLPQGELGQGLSLLVGRAPFVAASPVRGVLAPGQSASVELRLGAASLPAGTHPAELRVLSDDPSRPTADVPLEVQVDPRPILEMDGPAMLMTSSEQFFEASALTVHRFEVSGPVSGPGSLDVTVMGDFGDLSEFATVTIEGLVLGEVGGGGEDCNDVIGHFTLSPALLATLMADGVVEVSVGNSPGVDRVTCLDNTHQVSLALQAPLDPLDLGTASLGDTVRRTVSVVNPGGLALSVTVSATDEPLFSASPGAAVVPPGGRVPIEVRFAPRVEGEVLGALVVRGDDPVTPERRVTLRGVGATPPRSHLMPESVSVRLGPGFAVERPLALASVGGAELRWSARAEVPAADEPIIPLADELPLEEVLKRLDQRAAEITAPIPSLYDFREGVTGHGITDGGLDMYDGGNELSTNQGGPIPYSDGRVRVHAAFGGQGRYFTRKLPGLFVLAADQDGVTEFQVSGNLGADIAGRISGGDVFATRGAVGYRGLTKRVWAARQPSVNHLIVVRNQFGLGHSFPPSTDDDEHRISGLAGVRRIYYLVYSSLDGGLVTDAATDSIVNHLLDVVGAAPSWLTVGAESGIVPPGEEAVVPLTLDASSLGIGDHRAELTIETNDPFASRRQVPIRLRVVDTPVAEPGADSLRFPDRFVGRSADGELVITNMGSQTLVLSGLTTDVADFFVASHPASIEPGQEGRVRLLFRPVSSGERSGTLTVTCNDPERASLLVALSGLALLQPALELQPESTSVVVNSGEIATRILALCQTGGGLLSYTVVSDTASWLAVRGSSSGTLAGGECIQDTLVIDSRGLAGGVYTARVRVQSNAAAASERVHPVRLEVREAQVAVHAQLRVTPRTINPKAHAPSLFARLTLPSPIRRHDLVVSSLRFNGAVPLVSMRDPDDDDAGALGHSAVVLVLDRDACLATMAAGDRVPVMVTGRLRDGRSLVAHDTVRVLPKIPRDHDRAAAAGVEAPPVTLELSGGAPNPFWMGTRIRYGLPGAGTVRLEVFDLAGRRRRVVLDGVQPAGWHEAIWDGRDETGALVSPGVFVMRLDAGGETRTRRIARVPARP